MSHSGKLYTGVTARAVQRLWHFEHRNRRTTSFRFAPPSSERGQRVRASSADVPALAT
jgi:hypothetical protein